jgi:hypothetical protein
MKRNVLTRVLLSLCLVTLTIFASCNSGGSSSTTPTTLYDVTGTWFVGKSSGASNVVLHLTQDAQGNITGTVDRSVSSGGHDTGTIISGSNVNNTINIHALFGTMHYIFEGTVRDADNMDGTLTSYYEPKEQNQVYEEAFTATRAQ